MAQCAAGISRTGLPAELVEMPIHFNWNLSWKLATLPKKKLSVPGETFWFGQRLKFNSLLHPWWLFWPQAGRYSGVGFLSLFCRSFLLCINNWAFIRAGSWAWVSHSWGECPDHHTIDPPIPTDQYFIDLIGANWHRGVPTGCPVRTGDICNPYENNTMYCPVAIANTAL